MNSYLKRIPWAIVASMVAVVGLLGQDAKTDSVYFTMLDTQPVLIGGSEAIQSHLVYPELARRSGIEGTVHVGAEIDESGKVTSAKVIKSDQEIFNEAATNAVRPIKFVPGKRDGRAVRCMVVIPVKFRLHTLDKTLNQEQENVSKPSVFVVQGPEIHRLVEYPKASIKAGRQGIVFAKVSLDSRLQPRSVSILSGVDDACDKQVMHAAINYDYAKDPKIQKSSGDTSVTLGVRFVLPKQK